MPFESSDCQAAEPTELVSEGPFAGAAVVPPEVDIQNPRPGFDTVLQPLWNHARSSWLNHDGALVVVGVQE